MVIPAAQQLLKPLAWPEKSTLRGSSHMCLPDNQETHGHLSRDLRVIPNLRCSFPEHRLSKILQASCSNKEASKDKLGTPWTTYSSSSAHREELWGDATPVAVQHFKLMLCKQKPKKETPKLFLDPAPVPSQSCCSTACAKPSLTLPETAQNRLGTWNVECPEKNPQI